MSENKQLTYEEFRTHIKHNMKIKVPYRPLVLKYLVTYDPEPKSKEEISNDLRTYFNTREAYEKLRFWDDLVDNSLVTETNDLLSLNVEQLTHDQRANLHLILENKINNKSESSETESPQKPASSSSHTKNSASAAMPKLRTDDGYYLVRLKRNNISYDNKPEIAIFEKHSMNIGRQQLKKLKLSSHIQNLVIFFDTITDYVRIWGTAEIKVVKQLNPAHNNVEFVNFAPLNSENDSVIPKWLLKSHIRNSMFGNKALILIRKHDFDSILNNSVEEHDFLPEPRHPAPVVNVGTFPDEPLECPTRAVLDNGIRQIQQDLLVDPDTIKEIVFHLASKRHVILSGPIGTGKTVLAQKIPKIFWNKGNGDLGYRSKIYTATYDWNTSDVIAGIVPKMENDKPVYKIQYGCVVDTVRKNWDDESSKRVYSDNYRGTWTIIDEFNRADIDKAFGQLFTALETQKLSIPVEESPGLSTVKIPKDYRIIATMNTSDKHFLFKMSDALKRRFAIVEIGIPVDNDGEKEIYYALRNAARELPNEEFTSIIRLDESNMKIDYDDSNFHDAVQSIYEIFSFVRKFKVLGTGLLKSIFQTMLVGIKITNYDDSVTDIALNANLIPQLERVSNTVLESFRHFCFEDIHSFFRQKYNKTSDQTKQKYKDAFDLYLQYLGFDDHQKQADLFEKYTLGEDEWTSILNKWNEAKPTHLPMDLPKFKRSLHNLESSFDLS